MAILAGTVSGDDERQRPPTDEELRQQARNLAKDTGLGVVDESVCSDDESVTIRDDGGKRAKRKQATIAPKRRRRAVGAVPTSKKLPRDMWPEGYSSLDVDKLTVGQCILVRDSKLREAAKIEKTRSLPGLMVARKQIVRPLVTVPSGTDNGMDIIHPARFLRPPTGAVENWYKLAPIAYADKMDEHLQDTLGTHGQIPPSVYTASQDKGRALQMKAGSNKL